MTMITTETTAAQEVISRIMRRRLQDTCWTGSLYSDSQQHRATAGGKERQVTSMKGWRVVLALFVLVSSVSAATVGGGPEGHTRLENLAGVPYDPLQPHTDQLLLPVVAGVPSVAAAKTTNNTNPEGLSKEQQDYRNHLEMERVEREGSLYIELKPDERRLAASAVFESGTGAGAARRTRHLKEFLPWEGLEDEGEGREADQDGLVGHGIDSEDENSLGWSYSPWGGEFRYEISSPNGDAEDKGDGYDEFYYEEEEEGGEGRAKRKTRLAVSPRRQRQKDKFSAMAAVDNDDGSSVIEEQDYSRLELTTGPSQNNHNENMDKDTIAQAKEKTQTLKMEEPGASGESVMTQDPNVIDNTQEAAVDSQVWDAEGAQQKSPTGGDGNTQEYAQAPVSGSVNTAATQKEKEKEMEAVNAPGGGRSFAAEPVGSETILPDMDGSKEAEVKTVRPKLDQIDLLGHEAEVEWLQEQDEIQRAWSAKHHHRPSDGYEDDWDDEEEPYDDDEAADDGYDQMEEAGKRDDEEQDINGEEGSLSDELPLDDPNWHKKHGN